MDDRCDGACGGGLASCVFSSLSFLPPPRGGGGGGCGAGGAGGAFPAPASFAARPSPPPGRFAADLPPAEPRCSEGSATVSSDRSRAGPTSVGGGGEMAACTAPPSPNSTPPPPPAGLSAPSQPPTGPLA